MKNRDKNVVIATKHACRRSVGRPRAFDREAALDAALQVFWEHGYEAASLGILCTAMGLTPPQVYNAYIDKETLFHLALERYVARESAFAFRALGSKGSAKEAIQRLLNDAAESYTRPDVPRGCLTVTGAIVAPTSSAPVVEALRKQRKAIERLIAARLSRDEGDLPKTVDLDALARYFSAILFGMSIQARDGKSKADLLVYANMALLAWPKE